MSNSSEVNKALPQLSPARKALLEKWKQSSFTDTVHIPASMPKYPMQGSVALSFAQQRLWFLHQMEPQTPYYIMPLAVRLQGNLRTEILEQSLNEIIRRHGALRTTFPLDAGVPVQMVSSDFNVSIPIIDISNLSHSEQNAELSQLITMEGRIPFDLQSGPLIRPRLFRYSSKEHVFLLTVHHIITDGWSAGILIRELNTLYHTFSAGELSPLQDLPVQYTDYTLWQRQWLQGEALQNRLTYWREQLDGAPATLNLPADYPRPAAESFQGAIYTCTFPQELLVRSQAWCRQEHVTLFMMLLAVFQCLLARYTSQEDIVVGTPIANRVNTETEELIGCFVNTLVLRTDLRGNPSFLELLGRVREMCLSAYAHQDLPFEKLVEELRPERDQSRNPLFQVMFVLQNTSSTTLELDGLVVNEIPISSDRARFDLTLSMEETTQGLTSLFEYNTNLFKEQTIARMAGHYQTLLENVVSRPAQRLYELSLLTEKEQQQILVEWNATSIPSPEPSDFHALFELQVEHTPEAIAVITADQRLTYSELNRQANRLAHALRVCGAGPEVLVALLYERDVPLLVSILAVFKAGGAYLPLDPQQPAARQLQVIASSHVKLVLTTASLAPVLAQILVSLPDETRPQIIYIEEIMRQTSEIHEINVSVNPHFQQLAYVLYTSGSTGQPKGAMIEQRGMLNHLRAKITALQLTAADTIAQNASQCFDISIWQFLSALLTGGTVQIFSDAIAHDPLSLLLQVKQQQISILEVVPSMLRAMLEALEKAEEGKNFELPALRWLVLTGEALSPSLCRQWLSRYPHIPLMNAYGPTECSDDVTHYPITHSLAEESAITPIGRPIDNIRLYILDQHFAPVPIGIVGEVYVGGTGVGRGYLHDAPRTAEFFVPDPFAQKSGTRLYKTGDSARYRQDGTLEYLGRLDHQVKLRGHRIELGEIEAALGQHLDVLQCIVLLWENQAKEKMLIAYAVLEENKVLTSQELRHFLQQRLPEPMIPALFLFLKALPLTSNGKVDRHKLPEPEQEPDITSPVNGVSRTLTEDVIAGIWADVLKVEHAGTHANFFELGGHSLLATQVLSRVREAFQTEIPLRTLFAAPTLADFVTYVEKARWKETKADFPALTRNRRGTESFLSFAQQRLWFLEQWEPGTPLYSMPSAIHLTGQINLPIFEQSLNEILQRHEILRSTFTMREGKAIQIVNSYTPLKLPLIDLTDLSETKREQEIRRQTTTEAQYPFDLTKGPLFRVALLRISKQEHVMVLNMHHIVADGWSFAILLEELNALYEAFSIGQPSPFSTLPIQYADYVNWQRASLKEQVLQSHVTYWRHHLKNLPELELPIDRPRPAVPTLRGAMHTFVLPQTLGKELQTLSRREGVTLFMLLLATFQVLLSCYSGQEDVVVGTDIAGRPLAELEKVMGLFINMLVLRTDLSGNPTFHEILRRVRYICLEAYAHQDLPFERLVHLLNPKRGLHSMPLFQTCIALQNIPQTDLAIGDLALERLDIESETTKYDLLLVLEEKQQELKGWLGYATDLFNHSTIVDFAENFETLLSLVVTHRDTPLDRIKKEFTRINEEKQALKMQSMLANTRQRLKTIRQRNQDQSSR